MLVEQGILHPIDTAAIRKNEVRWDGQILKIPRLGFTRAFVDYGSHSSDDRIISIDEHDQAWLQIGSYSSLHRAKARVRLELARDSKRANGYYEEGVLHVTVTELSRAIKYGILPESVEECTSKGLTHVAFGPALEISFDPESGKDLQSIRNQVGIWRPSKELGFERNQRHKDERFKRELEKLQRKEARSA